ncbi:MAG: condensation domain-containing protein, partial [Pirellulales bacterium]
TRELLDRHGDSVLDLPLDYPRPPRFTGRAGSESLTFSAQTSAAIGTLATAVGVTPSAVMLAAVELLLGRFSGQSRFLIGMPFSGRSRRQFEDTVGFFVNILPIPARLDGDGSFRDLVKQTGDTLMGALEHEAYPFAAIVADSRCGFDPSRSPLFQVSCTFEKSHRRDEAGRAGFLFPDRAEAVNFAGLHQESFPVPQQACVHDLEFVFEQADAGYRGVVHFCRDLFTAETIAGLARCLEDLATILTDHPDRPLATVSWPVTTSLPPPQPRPQVTVMDLLSPVIDQQAEQPAFVIGDRTWTYRDLSGLSQAVSRAGAAAGLSVCELVPVVGDRRQGMLATVATLLAGAAPLPVDAEQPAAPLAD